MRGVIGLLGAAWLGAAGAPSRACAEPVVSVAGAAAVIADGTAHLSLAPVLIVGASAKAKDAATTRRLPFHWTRDPIRCGPGNDNDPRAPCSAAVAELRTADGALAVTLGLAHEAGDAGATLTADAVWLLPSWVHLVAVELELPGAGTELIGRDLAPASARSAYLERFDPKWITVGAATLVVDDAVDSVEVRASGGHVVVRIDLDAADARPFLHDARCTAKWRAPNRHLAMPSRLHAVGDRVHARAQVMLAPVTPLVLSRWPDGRRAALAISDHADQSSARTLDVLARGLIGNHVAITKALFARGADRPQLEVPEVVELADAMAAAGSEIVPHSATPKPDDRATTSAALEQFERWHARTWIDHQPETNCEAFGDQGFRIEGKFGIADLLAGHHYQYVWAEDDAQPGDLNLLEPKRLDHRAPTVWPIGRLEPGGPEALWMFRSMWAFIEATRFYKMYGNDRLDKLERERGLHIAHTYLETYHPRRTRFGLRNLIVPVDPRRHKAGDDGPVKLDARFEALLASLAGRQARGTLWVPTIGELGDRLRATSEVTLRLAADGTMVAHTPRALAGATFVVPGGGVTVEIGGHAPRGQRSLRGELTFWDDLPEGETTIRLQRTPPPGH